MKKSMLKTLMHVGTIASACILGGLSGSAIAASSGDIARDLQEIQNTMGRRFFYHSVGQNEKELELWAKKSPIRWAQNQGCWVGIDALREYYVTTNYAMQRANLAKKSKANPAIENNFEKNRQIGESVYHLLTSPIIEVAKDGKTAKAVWYTPGVILTGNGVKSEGMDMWERYGVDFIKEDGQWRFLHIEVFTDFAKPLGDPLTVQSESAATVGTEGAAQQGPGPGAEGGAIKVPGPTIAKKLYEEFSQTRVPVLKPRLPEPYTTYSKTFEYADCSGK